MGEASTAVSTFVGRQRELGVLDELRRLARTGGMSGLALVTGEAGIGKTRLCREVAARAEADGFQIAWGSCWAGGGAPPLWPWTAIMHTLDGAGGLREGVTGAERFARFAAVAERLAAACARAPVLVIIDDIHDADADALALTRFVTRTLSRLPLVVMLTRRSNVDSSWDPASEAIPVPLGRFEPHETSQYLRQYRPAGDDEELLHRLTGGHPLHLQRMLAQGGRQADGSGGVRAALAVAVGQISDRARHILCRAAVLGPGATAAEAAAVTDVPLAEVHLAFQEAASVGLLDDDGYSFAHDLVREALMECLSADDLTDTHARAAAVLSPDRLVRRAFHAVRAAVRSPEDARIAIEAGRAAAQAMIDGLAYERAAALLAEAAGGYERAGLGEPAAVVLVEWAEAVLMCGRLAESRPLFTRAAAAAEAERDPVLLARATLGLGGVWVNEHRTRIDHERVMGLQRRALAGLPEDEQLLRLRLTIRLAAEDAYQGGPVEPILDTLAAARRHGDPRVLAEALSLCHHALLTPAHTGTRLALADELIRVAAGAGEGMFALVGLCWRTVDLFHLGDPGAIRSLAELRDRADALGCLSVLYVAEAMEVMLLIRAGRLAEAEEQAYACFELGTRVGDADAPAYLGAHLMTLRWLQLRDAEILDTVDSLADSPTLNPAEFAFQANQARLAAQVGQHDRAQALLDRLAAPGLAALPDSSTWLAGLGSIVETARLLGDGEVARKAYQLLIRYADQPMMPSLAVTCLGSVERMLGLAAATSGELDQAIAHLDRAVAANRRLGNRPVTAIARAELAELLVRRGRGREAMDLFRQAAADATAMGLAVRAAQWSDRLRELTDEVGTIRRQGRSWLLAVRDKRAIVPDRVGVRYLAHLLTHPGQPVAVLDLTGAGPAASRARQPVLDDTARTAYRRRLRDLAAAIEEAAPARAAALRGEREALLDELRRAAGLSGRARTFPDAGERARTAVRKAIKRAIDEIAASEPRVGALLRDTVSTGATCCYAPDPERPVRWTYAHNDRTEHADRTEHGE